MNAKSDGLAGGSCSPSVACPVSQGAQPVSALPGPLSGLPGLGVPKTDTLFSAPRAPSLKSIAAAGRYGACKKPHIYLRRERPSKKHPQGKPCWVCKNNIGIASATTPVYAFRAWRRNLEYKTRVRSY